MAFSIQQVKTEAGLKALNEHLASRSFLNDGASATPEDLEIAAAISAVKEEMFPHVARWHRHISFVRKAFPIRQWQAAGTTAPAAAAGQAPAAVAAGGDDAEAQVKAVGDEIRALKDRLKAEGITGQKLNNHEEVKALVAKLAELKAAAAAAPGDPAATAAKEGDMVVDPWSVSGKIDYTKLVEQFGSTLITPGLLNRVEKLTVGRGNVPSLHPWLVRSIFFSHRDLDRICKCREEGKPFYLYTGRGPSSASLHLGHLIPFMMTKWLQDAFNVPLVIQMTDDEKFLWKGKWEAGKGDDLMHYRYLTTENAKDIIACGFDKKKTFIFSDLDYFGHMYPNIIRIWKAVTYNTARSSFGFENHSNIGQSAFPAVQAAPSFPSTFKVPLKGQDQMACLIPCAIDQDPYFRITRDVAHKLVPANHPLRGKPGLLHSKFFPPLQGAEGKMSASDENSAVYLTDTPKQIEDKIRGHAFVAKAANGGADLDLDVSYQWLRFFLHDAAELEKIEKSYGSGKGEYASTKAVQDKLVAVLQDIVHKHQERRKLVTDKEVEEWLSVRELEF